MEQKKKSRYTLQKIIATIFLCLVCISIGQVVQHFIQTQINKFLGINILGYVTSTIVYIGVVYAILKVICIKILNTSMELCRVGKLQIKLKWFAISVILPVLVSAIMLCIPGELIKNNLSGIQVIDTLCLQVFVYALGGGVIEEMIFRGVMMSSIENRYGKLWAIIIPSVIFSLGHLANDSMNPSIMIMKIIAGITVGCMFSLVVYESNSIWNSIIIHILWNASVNGGLINISLAYDANSLFSYVIDKEYSFITGGALSVEPSLVAIVCYIIVSLIAGYCLKKRKQNKTVLDNKNDIYCFD